MQLRPYQSEVIESVADGRRRMYSRQLVILPTGAGKTVVFVSYAKRVLDTGRSVLILAHREDLVFQAADKARQLGLSPGIEMAKLQASPDDRLVIASVASLWGQQRRVRRPFDLIIVDEAHHSLAPKWRDFLETLSPNFDKEYLGVTATPFRADRGKLLDWWERIAGEVTLTQLIRDGYLANIVVRCLPIKVDLPSVRGEMSPEQADAIITPILRQIAREVVEAMRGRRSVVVFLPLIETSKRFAAMLREAGVTAAHVDGEMDRESIMRDFREGRIQYLTNASVLTEGWDEPCVDGVVPLRPIKSQSLYQQMVGRGTRLFEGKQDMLLLDLLWQAKQHYARPATLLNDDPDLAFEASRQAVERTMDLHELVETVSEKVRIDREMSIARKAKELEKRKAYTVNLTQFCAMNQISVPTVREGGPMASEKQLAVLRRFHVTIPPEGLSRAAATSIIGQTFDRHRRNRAGGKR